MKYERCDKCGYQATQVITKVLGGKRIDLCFDCAREAGWFEPDEEQGKLF